MDSIGSHELTPLLSQCNDKCCPLVPVACPGKALTEPANSRPPPIDQQPTHPRGPAALPCRAPVHLRYGQHMCRHRHRVESRQSTPRNMSFHLASGSAGHCLSAGYCPGQTGDNLDYHQPILGYASTWTPTPFPEQYFQYPLCAQTQVQARSGMGRYWIGLQGGAMEWGLQIAWWGA